MYRRFSKKNLLMPRFNLYLRTLNLYLLSICKISFFVCPGSAQSFTNNCLKDGQTQTCVFTETKRTSLLGQISTNGIRECTDVVGCVWDIEVPTGYHIEINFGDMTNIGLPVGLSQNGCQQYINVSCFVSCSDVYIRDLSSYI